MPKRLRVWFVSRVLAMLSFLMVALSMITFLAVLHTGDIWRPCHRPQCMTLGRSTWSMAELSRQNRVRVTSLEMLALAGLSFMPSLML